MALAQRDVVFLLSAAKTVRQRQFLLGLLASQIVERPIIPNVRFDLGSVADANAILDYRFDVAGIRQLGLCLGIPAVVITPLGSRVLRDEAMCILLGRMAFPTRLHDMAKTFGRSRSALSEIFLHVINLLYSIWGSLLYFNTKLVAKNMDRYCSAIHRKGSPLTNVFGFIDGTKVQTCRIASTGEGLNLQKQIYSGHKRIHCLSYQAVTCPDGICVHFFGPVEGRRHDATMLRQSELLTFFDQHCDVFSGKYIYGDPAYGVVQFLLSGYRGSDVDEPKREFNKWMSRVRQSVEWNFKLFKTGLLRNVLRHTRRSFRIVAPLAVSVDKGTKTVCGLLRIEVRTTKVFQTCQGLRHGSPFLHDKSTTSKERHFCRNLAEEHEILLLGEVAALGWGRHDDVDRIVWMWNLFHTTEHFSGKRISSCSVQNKFWEVDSGFGTRCRGADLDVDMEWFQNLSNIVALPFNSDQGSDDIE